MLDEDYKTMVVKRLANEYRVIPGYSGGGVMEVQVTLLYDAFFHSKLWADSDFDEACLVMLVDFN